MAKKETKNDGISAAQKVTLGVGLTAAAVAAASTYFLYGSKNAPKNRKAVKSWILKAKGEVLEALEKAEDMTKAEYEALIEMIAGAYGAVQGASKNEIAEFKKEMKSHWDKIQKSGVVKKAVNAVTPAKKAAPAKKTAAKKVPAQAASAPAKKTAAKKAAVPAAAKKAAPKKAAAKKA